MMLQSGSYGGVRVLSPASMAKAVLDQTAGLRGSAVAASREGASLFEPLGSKSLTNIVGHQSPAGRRGSGTSRSPAPDKVKAQHLLHGRHPRKDRPPRRGLVVTPTGTMHPALSDACVTGHSRQVDMVARHHPEARGSVRRDGVRQGGGQGRWSLLAYCAPLPLMPWRRQRRRARFVRRQTSSRVAPLRQVCAGSHAFAASGISRRAG